MKMFHQKLRIFTLLLMIPIYGEAQENSVALSFDDALQMTLNNSEVLKQAGFSQKQVEQELKSTRTLRLPQLSLNAGYVWLSDDITIDMGSVRDAITPLYSALANYGNFSGVPNPDPATAGVMPILPDDLSTQAVRDQLTAGLNQVQNADWTQHLFNNNFGTLNATAMWPLFTGGKINAANKAAKLKLKEAAEVERQKTGELMSELVERYFGLALSYQAEEVRKEVLGSMELHLDDAQKMFDEGMIAKAELLHAKVYHAQADRELKKNIRDRSVINESLNNTLASEETVNYMPLTPLFYLENIESPEYFKTLALSNNPLLSQVANKKNMAHQNLKAERSGMMPTIAAVGTYNIASHNMSPLMPDYMAGVTLSWDLVGFYSSAKKKNAARYMEDQVEQVQYKAVRDIELGIEKYHQEIQMALEQLHELESAYEFASEYYRIRQEAFNEGMATSAEVVDASLAVAKVRIDRLQAIYQYDLSLAKLLELAGTPDRFLEYRDSAGAIKFNDL